MRPFIHIAGSKAAKQIATEAARGTVLALAIGLTAKVLVFDQEKKEIAAYYNKLGHQNNN